MIAKLVGCCSILLLLTQPFSVFAGVSEKNAMDMVAGAATYASKEGVAKLESEIAANAPSFVKKDSYVYTFKLETGKFSTHPKDPSLVGTSFSTLVDPDGKQYGLEISNLSKSIGSGRVEFKSIKADKKAKETKVIYFAKVNDVVICSMSDKDRGK